MSVQPSSFSRYARSLELWQRSKQSVIPGSSTISKRADLYPLGAFPIYLTKSEGAYVEDVDGNRFVDFQSALGAVLLGSNYPAVTEAIATQLKKGNLFSLSHDSLITLAEKICKFIPCAERVRVLKNGSDATTGAARIARAYTGRDTIFAGHYHGWHDWYYVSTNLNAGIPQALKENIIPFPYGDLERLEKLFQGHEGKVAGVIMEATHLETPPPGYLAAVKEMAHRHGAILIFDEVVTGFRFGLGGAQEYFQVTPDVACFAKALGNGAPISLIAGSAKVMDATSDVVTTQTYGEDCLAIAAALATLEVLEHEPVVSHIWQLGSLFQDGYHALAKKHGIATECIGYPPRLQLEFSDLGDLNAKFLKSYILQETAKDGFLIAHMIFMNYSHTKEHVEALLASIERAFLKIKASERPTLDGHVAVDLW